jgi:ribulose-5-phosphate 4-epimerase/fuculose-1-phosphate aldolase
MDRRFQAVTNETANTHNDIEWQTRVDLAACYRLVAAFGMTDLIYNHITARIPGSPDHILINPYGMMYEEITASSLIKIDLEGNIIGDHDSRFSVNAAGYVIHSAVHAARHDVQCVLHTHTRAGSAVSAMKSGLISLAQTSMRFARIAYHDYESVALKLSERERLVADLGNGEAMILRNHGLLTVGPSIAQAFNLMYWLEMACKIQIDALSGGAELVLPSQAIIDETYTLYQPQTRRPFGEMEWPAMLRYLDRRDTSYKT